jgi:signal transduction histidine kinase
MTGLSPFGDSRDERGHVARQVNGTSGAQATFLRTSVLPAVVIAAVCVGGAAFALAANVSAGTLRAVVVGITCCAVVMLICVVMAAKAVSREMSGQVSAIRIRAQRGQAELHRLAETILRGEQPVPPAPVQAPGRVASGDPFRLLAYDLEQTQYAAGQALLRVADRTGGGRTDQRVEIFVNLARRMQSLVHREIEMLDDLEAQVEDPDLLKGLFTVDHLATRMRRQSESLAVLGGSASRRQWTRQVTMHEVLRAAVAEVEQYSRVKIVPPVEGMLRGAAVADVIHLIAELVENATKFSAPRTQALLRAQQVAAGVAIEIEDRGLGMLAPDQQRMNALLTEPGRIDIDELLRDGRIGLYVVSTLARRHNIRVQLQSNIYGGTSAVVVLPDPLLQEGSEHQLPHNDQAGPEADRELVSAGVTTGGIPVGGAVGVSGAGGAAGGPTPASGFSSSRMPWDDHVPATRQAPAPAPAPVRDDVFTPAPKSGAARPPLSQIREYPAPQSAIPADRPPLPKRQAQTSIAAQLRDRHGDFAANDSSSSSARHAEPPADQMPGLMADFLRGVSRSEDEDTPAGD